jgi:hypothetical protein
MASLDLVAIRQALADQIADNTSLRVYPIIPDVPEFPCCTIESGDPYIELHQAMTGALGTLVKVNLTVSVYVAASSSWRDAQTQLDRLLSSGLTPDNCVYSAIESDRTLDGTVQDCVATSVRGLAREMIQTDNGVMAYSSSIDVEIYAYR